ncbi:MAG: long-chain fatty acid--CoA ligase [Acidobacteria bacterium]|nr:MAG: long-chain fatty acid--CoA ligase [Acidobacteriota bacterium]
MKGLMQERPLDIPMIVRHAERLHPRKTVASKTADGVRVASFAEVLDRARRLITALRRLGVGPDDRVATFCWNHQQHLEAYVGVPCMGAILHTLNIRLFPQDLAYIVDHAQDMVAIVDKSLWPAWQRVAERVSCVRHVIVVDDAPGPAPDGTLDYETLVASAEPAELADVDENQAAAMCYTSGTTGHPKGVLYSHRSNVLHSMALCMADAFGVRESDVVMAIVPMFHANAWGLPYAAFMAGTDVVMPGRFMTPDVLTSLLVERGVTFAAGVPTIWQAMLEPMKQARGRLGRLRCIICGGSAVPPALQKAFQRDVGIRITHAWGMTETSPMGSVCREIAARQDLAGDEMDAMLATQGRPVFGVEVRVVGEDGAERPWDGKAVGEIEVRGNWIASAYYRDPSGDRFHDGWLRTGDVAAIDPDGYIRIADRTKDLIKSGGEWISSVALEGIIMAHPDVAEAAVIAVPHPRWCERPLACVVARPDARERLTREGVLDHLRPKVAKWWLPDDVVFIEQVPKTSVGKFDKKALRERFREHELPSVATDGTGGRTGT